MKCAIRITASFGVIALGVALASSPLEAQEAQGFHGTAIRVVSALTEPGALLVWGAVLAGLAHAFGRRESST